MPDYNYFLKIEGVPGEVTDKALPDSMELLSWSWGTSQRGVGQGGTGTGKVKFDELHFTMEQSKAAPVLFQATVSGQHFSKAAMVVAQNSNVTMRADMTDILVSSFNLSGAGGGSTQPLVTASITFADLKIQFTDAKSMAYQGSGTSYSLKTAGS